MELKIWIMYLVAEFFLSITPGPAVMLVSAQGFKYGAKPSYFGACGISLGNLMYFVLSALGLGAVILAAGDLFFYIKAAGALYLICTGLLMIYGSFKRMPENTVQTNLEQNNFKSFLQGLTTQVANPKAIIFFVALLPQFIDQSKNIALQFSILALTTTIMETFILMCYGWVAANGKRFAEKNKNISKWQDRFAGSVLVGLGINLFFIKSKN